MKSVKRAIIRAFSVLLAAIVLAGCSFFAPSTPDAGKTGNGKVRVMLEKTEGLVILSGFYADADPGGDVTFEVRAEEGYEILSAEGGEYDPALGTVMVKNVRYPLTVTVKTVKNGPAPTYVPVETPHVTPEPTATPTPAPSTPTPVPTPEPTEMPTPKEETTPEAPGITLKDPVLNEKLYPASGESFDSNLETNYKITYYANGGTVNGYTTDAAYMYFPRDNYLMPNALPDTGYFKKEGHILAGYTENGDGSGAYYAPGWNVPVDENGEAKLYCRWEPAEPEDMFDCELTDYCAVIRSYNGNASKVVIPEKIAGKKVVKIAGGAFSGKGISTVYIPKYVETIEWGAFANCPSLTSAHIPDSVVEMSDGAFSGSPMKTAYISAVRNPSYMYSLMGNGTVKYERLETAKGKKIIIISGSGCLYGIDSKLMEEELPGYTVVNLGLLVNISAVFNAELAASFTSEGDYVIFSPEMNELQYGLDPFSTTMWKSFEAAYEVLARVDIRNYPEVWTSFGAFNAAKRDMAEGRYSQTSSDFSLNKYGDLSSYFTETQPSYGDRQSYYLSNGGSLGLDYPTSMVKNYSKRFNEAMDRVNATGAKCLFAFCLMDRACLIASALVPGGEAQKAYENAVDSILHADRISTVNEYIYEPELFYNSEWHVTGEGRTRRSKQLAGNIKQYVENGPIG